jgi:hypothetical protein
MHITMVLTQPKDRTQGQLKVGRSTSILRKVEVSSSFFSAKPQKSDTEEHIYIVSTAQDNKATTSLYRGEKFGETSETAGALGHARLSDTSSYCSLLEGADSAPRHNLACPTGTSFISATSTALRNLETALYPQIVNAESCVSD